MGAARRRPSPRYRELAGHDDRRADALGPAPQPGQAEAYAAYRAAWRALGRPEVDREETELSDGQLRMRVRAWEREKPWAPRYVGNELAGTRQAAAHQHRVAALRDAEAAAAAATGDDAGQPGSPGRPPTPPRSPRPSTSAPPSCRSSTTPAPSGSPTPP